MSLKDTSTKYLRGSLQTNKASEDQIIFGLNENQLLVSGLIVGGIASVTSFKIMYNELEPTDLASVRQAKLLSGAVSVGVFALCIYPYTFSKALLMSVEYFEDTNQYDNKGFYYPNFNIQNPDLLDKGDLE